MATPPPTPRGRGWLGWASWVGLMAVPGIAASERWARQARPETRPTMVTPSWRPSSLGCLPVRITGHVFLGETSLAGGRRRRAASGHIAGPSAGRRSGGQARARHTAKRRSFSKGPSRRTADPAAPGLPGGRGLESRADPPSPGRLAPGGRAGAARSGGERGAGGHGQGRGAEPDGPPPAPSGRRGCTSRPPGRRIVSPELDAAERIDAALNPESLMRFDAARAGADSPPAGQGGRPGRGRGVGGMTS